MADSSGNMPPKPARLERYQIYLANYDQLQAGLSICGIVAAIIYGSAVGARGYEHMFAALAGAMLALLVAGGAFSCGALVGFLFGLPRTLTSTELREVSNSQSSAVDANGVQSTDKTAITQSGQQLGSDVNTNLEQISDWLTKIIVGVGLTKIEEVPRQLDTFGGNVEGYFNAGGHVFAVGAGLYFLVLGFFVAYFGTRVKLSYVFVKSQIHNKGARDGTEDVGHLELDQLNARPLFDQVNNEREKEIDSLLLSKSLTQITSDSELLAWANAKMRDGKAQEALAAYKDLVKRLPMDASLATNYASALALAGETKSADNVMGALSAIEGVSIVAEGKQQLDIAKLRRTMLDGLYRQNGMTPKDTVKAGESLLSIPEQANDPMIHIWLACALAQDSGKTVSVADRKKIVEALTQALRLDPSKASFIASLYDPKLEANDEDDLQPLFPDPDIERLLGRGP